MIETPDFFKLCCISWKEAKGNINIALSEASERPGCDILSVGLNGYGPVQVRAEDSATDTVVPCQRIRMGKAKDVAGSGGKDDRLGPDGLNEGLRARPCAAVVGRHKDLTPEYRAVPSDQLLLGGLGDVTGDKKTRLSVGYLEDEGAVIQVEGVALFGTVAEVQDVHVGVADIEVPPRPSFQHPVVDVLLRYYPLELFVRLFYVFKSRTSQRDRSF